MPSVFMLNVVMPNDDVLNVVMLSIVVLNVGEKKVFTTFTEANEWAQYARMFVPGRSFQPSIMFVSKAGAYLSEAPFWRGVLSQCSSLMPLSVT